MWDSMTSRPAKGSPVQFCASANRQYLLCRRSKPRGSPLMAFASSALLHECSKTDHQQNTAPEKADSPVTTLASV